MRFSSPRAAQHLKSVRRLLACCAFASLVGAGVGNAEPDQALSVAIAPQSMADALTEFARQTGLQLVYLSEVARARTSKGAPAGLAPGDALTQLLEGTGLGFEFLNPRAVRIFERAAVATVGAGGDCRCGKTQRLPA